MARLQRWINRTITARPDPEQQQLLHRYAVWHLLRRLRGRLNGADTTHTQAVVVQQHVKAAVTLLDWLTAHHLTLTTAGQGDLEAWLTSGDAAHRREAGNFVRWANNQKLTNLEFAAVRWSGPSGVIDTETRWEQARWLLHDDTIKPEDRVAGLLVLLYAQWPAAISRLTLDHVDTNEHEVRLRLGREPVILPEPFATLTRHLLATRRGHAAIGDPGTSRWLFPGGQPGRPISTYQLAERLRQLGLRPGQSRSTALFQLATDLPAAMLSHMLGIHITVAVAWQRASSGDWTNYAADVSRRQRHRGFPGSADDQVTFPMSGDLAAGDLGGAGVDAGHAHDPGSWAGGAAAGAALRASGAQRDSPSGKLALGQGVEPGVDRIVGHPPSVLVGVLIAQPARDLVRGAPGPQFGHDLFAQHQVHVELAYLGPMPVRRGLMGGPVAFPPAVPGNLPRHHAGVPADPLPGQTLGNPPGRSLRGLRRSAPAAAPAQQVLGSGAGRVRCAAYGAALRTPHPPGPSIGAAPHPRLPTRHSSSVDRSTHDHAKIDCFDRLGSRSPMASPKSSARSPTLPTVPTLGDLLAVFPDEAGVRALTPDPIRPDRPTIPSHHAPAAHQLATSEAGQTQRCPHARNQTP